MASSGYKRYGVYWVELAPARGRGLRKMRPGGIVSRDELNAAIDTVVVCPLTSSLHPAWPTRLRCKIAGKAAEIAVDQIRVVRKERLRGRLGVLTPCEAARLREILHSTYSE